MHPTPACLVHHEGPVKEHSDGCDQKLPMHGDKLRQQLQEKYPNRIPNSTNQRERYGRFITIGFVVEVNNKAVF